MICIPIKEKKIDILIKNIKKAQKIADIIEIWFDELENDITEDNLKKIFKSVNKPLIYKSMGNWSNIQKILSNNPEFIDLDIKTSQKLLNKLKKQFKKTKIILSYHNFKRTPIEKDILKITEKMQEKHADIIKIATFANLITDSFRMLSILSKLSKEKKVIFICMGDKGRITRTTGHLFGNYLMYAPLDLKRKTAEGQITAKELIEIQNILL